MKFRVTLDVTMSGSIYIEANSLEEATKKISEKSFTPQDLKSFHYVGKDIFEVEEVK